MTEYEKNKMYIANKAVEIVDLIKKQEETTDTVQKVNIYLLRKYKDELLKEFEIDVAKEEKFIAEIVKTNNESIKQLLIINKIYSIIAEKMNKEMPDPWYCYGFGGKVDK